MTEPHNAERVIKAIGQAHDLMLAYAAADTEEQMDMIRDTMRIIRSLAKELDYTRHYN